jgi:hypothetical protein
MRVGTRNPLPSWPLIDVVKRDGNPMEGVLVVRRGRGEDEEYSGGGAKLTRG